MSLKHIFMPRLIDHPRASFKNGQEIAMAVDYLGGSCSLASCAEKMGKKVSGAFKGLVSAAVKHGLVVYKNDILTTTDSYRTIKLAYNDIEKTEMLRKAFLQPVLYQKIYERFKGKDLPIAMLSRLLIREFGVEEVYGSRVAGYFIDGAKSVHMLDNGKLIDNIKMTIKNDTNDLNEDDSETQDFDTNQSQHAPKTNSNSILESSLSLNHNAAESFAIAIVGPGMNTKIIINEEDDFLILDAMLNKIKKKLKEGSK